MARPNASKILNLIKAPSAEKIALRVTCRVIKIKVVGIIKKPTTKWVEAEATGSNQKIPSLKKSATRLSKTKLILRSPKTTTKMCDSGLIRSRPTITKKRVVNSVFSCLVIVNVKASLALMTKPRNFCPMTSSRQLLWRLFSARPRPSTTILASTPVCVLRLCALSSL